MRACSHLWRKDRDRLRPLAVAMATAVAMLICAQSAMAANGFWTVQFEQPSGGSIQVDSEVPVMQDVYINPFGFGQLVDHHYIEYVPDNGPLTDQLPQQQLTGTCPGTAGLCSTSGNAVAHNLPSTDTEIDVPFGAEGVSFNRPYLLPNHQITVTAIPAPGYYFIGWSGGGCAADPSCQIAYLQDADINAQFSQCPPGGSCLTLSTSPGALGSVTVHQGSESGPVITPPGDCTAQLCTYQVASGTQLTLVPTATGSAEFDSWTGCEGTAADGSCTLTISSNQQVQAKFDDPLVIHKPAWELALLVNVNNQYVADCAATACKYRLQPGDSVELDRFVQYGSDAGNYSAALGWTGCSSPTLSPEECDVTMSGAQTVTASYTDFWTVQVVQLPHGEVVSSPAGIDCGDSDNECSASFPTDSTVSFSATAAPGYTVGGWNQSIPQAQSSGECASAGGSATCVDTLDHSPRPFGASFFPDLSTNVIGSGSTAVSGDGGIACSSGVPLVSATGTSCEAFAPGTAVEVSQLAAPQYAFDAFAGCDNVLTGGGDPAVCQLTLDAPASVTTTFAGTYEADVSVTSDSYGSVAMTPCPSSGTGTCSTVGVGNLTTTFNAATAVTLTETPSSGGTFTGWSGGGCSGTQTTCQTTIGAFLDAGDATHITANYVPSAALQVAVLGEGNVTSSPAGISCIGPATCAGSFSLGSAPTFTASAASGWSFAGWSGDGSSCGTAATCSLTVSGAPARLIATFVPAAPITTTTAAGTAAATSVPVNGTVDPNGYATTYHFEWGTTTSYGTDTVPGSLAPSIGPSPVSATLGGLTPETTYHYRLVATNMLGTTYGADQSFATTAVIPTVTTAAPSALAGPNATLNAVINPEGVATTYQFEYGTSPGSLSSVTTVSSAGSGDLPVSVSAVISGLTPPTEYFWQVVATNVYGPVTVAGGDFNAVLEAPVVTAQPATNVGPSTATINAQINTEGASGLYLVQCNTASDSTYVNETSPQAIGASSTAVAESVTLTGLTSRTSYNCRYYVETDSGNKITAGPASAFTTPSFTADTTQSSVTADNQTAESVPDYQRVALSVTLRTAAGQQLPYGGDKVRISSTLGSVSAVTDNGDGTYSATLTSHSAGTATVTATVDGTQLQTQPAVSFQAGNLDGETSPITANPGTTIVLGQDTAPTVTLQAADSAGSPLAMSGQSTSIEESYSDGTVTNHNGLTDANGQFTVALTPPPSPGTATIIGYISGEGPTAIEVHFIASSSVAARWTDSGATPGDGQSAATVTLQLTDISGNDLTSSEGPVVFSTSAPGVAISAVTDHANGTYSATVTSTSAQTAQITAAFADHPDSPLAQTESADFTLPPASASLSTVTGPSQSVTDTTTAAVSATVLDADGNPIANAPVEFDCVQAGDQCATGTTDSGGDVTAQIPDTLSAVTGSEPVSVVVDPRGGDVTLTESVQVTFVPDSLLPSATTVDSSDDSAANPQQVGRPAFITVTTRDAAGGAQTTGGATVSLASTLGTLSDVTDNGDGSYSASLTSTQVGTATITATVNGVVSSHTGAAYFANPPADPASTFTASTGSEVAGQGVTLAVHAEDADGFALVGQPVVFTCPRGNVTVTSDGSGDASTTCTSDVIGAVNFTASIGDQTLSSTPAVQFVAGSTDPANSLLTATGPAVADGSYSIRLAAVDSLGNPTHDGAHQVELHTTLGSFSSSSAVTDVQAQTSPSDGAGLWVATLYPSASAGTAHITGTVDGVAVNQNLNLPLAAAEPAGTSGSPTAPSTSTTPGATATTSAAAAGPPKLASSAPAAGSTVGPVGWLELRADEPVTWSGLSVHGPHGITTLANGTGSTIARAFASAVPGTYTVDATLSAGGQSTSDSYTFTIALARSARAGSVPGPVATMTNATAAGSVRLPSLPLAGGRGMRAAALRVSWPANAFGQAAVVSLLPAKSATSKFSAAVSLTAIGAGDGDAITRFAAPIQLIFRNVSAHAVPQISVTGRTWRPVPKLARQTHLRRGATGYVRRGRTLTISTWSAAFFRIRG